MTDHAKLDRILVLGIGNILWADEGFGVRVVEEFHRRYAVPDNVTILDGGTQGLYLVNYVEEADGLIVFDAIDYGLAPDELELAPDRVPGGPERSRSARPLSAPARLDRLPAARSRGLGRPIDGA